MEGKLRNMMFALGRSDLENKIRWFCSRLPHFKKWFWPKCGDFGWSKVTLLFKLKIKPKSMVWKVFAWQKSFPILGLLSKLVWGLFGWKPRDVFFLFRKSFFSKKLWPLKHGHTPHFSPSAPKVAQSATLLCSKIGRGLQKPLGAPSWDSSFSSLRRS